MRKKSEKNFSKNSREQTNDNREKQMRYLKSLSNLDMIRYIHYPLTCRGSDDLGLYFVFVWDFCEERRGGVVSLEVESWMSFDQKVPPYIGLARLVT